nr:MAG TPA: hypothetical protein [Caudoviricetes sp.]
MLHLPQKKMNRKEKSIWRYVQDLRGLFLYQKTEKVEEKTYDTLSDFILVWDSFINWCNFC